VKKDTEEEKLSKKVKLNTGEEKKKVDDDEGEFEVDNL
jgi:hypothetical protein